MSKKNSTGCVRKTKKLAHAMSGCAILLQTEYFAKHDGMARAIVPFMSKAMTWRSILPWSNEDCVENAKEK